MADKKIIAVVGATGAQGGGVARAILAEPLGEFSVRALTRDIHSEKAKALASAGAEVVQANIDDPASIERAFDGAYGAYCVTFFWDHLSAAKEIAEASIMAHAAQKAGIRHAIWSTFEDTRRLSPPGSRMPTLQGKYNVPHFDGKAEADHFFTECGVPTTFLLTSFYWENLIYFGSGPKRGEDGVLYLTFPLGDSKMPGIAAEDIGKCALGIFKRGKEFIGKTVGIAGEHVSGAEMASVLTKALGQEVRYQAIDADAYRALGFPGADETGNMFQFKRDFEREYRGARSVDVSRTLNPQLQSFEQWVQHNKERIPLG